MASIHTMRRFYARFVTAGVKDPRITEAFAAVPREAFLDPGPWLVRVDDGYLDTETDDPAVLYQDLLVALSAEKGLHNGQPTLHARCLDAVAVRPGDRVIHVGAGTGYYTALLAHLAGADGHVDAFEVEPELAQRAAENLATYSNVIVHCRSALVPPLPDADAIYVSAGLTTIPLEWLDALRPAARLVLPLTPGTDVGCMIVVTRTAEHRYAARTVGPVAFVPCVDGQTPDQAAALATALKQGLADRLRAVRRDEPPDESACLVGRGWWLSAREP